LKLKEALSSLIDGKPTNEVLIEEARAGRLKLTLGAVALEAGCSPTLISGPACAYPEIRNAVMAHKPKRDLLAEIAVLEAEILELKKQLLARDSINAEILVRAREFAEGRKQDGKAATPKSPQQRRTELAVVGTKRKL
jgi:hypothetical protein